MSLLTLPQEVLAFIVANLNSCDRNALSSVHSCLCRIMSKHNFAFWADVYAHQYGERIKTPSFNETPFESLMMRDIANDFLMYHHLSVCTAYTTRMPAQIQFHEQTPNRRRRPSANSRAVTPTTQDCIRGTVNVAHDQNMLRVSKGRGVFCGYFETNGQLSSKILGLDADITSLCMGPDGMTVCGLNNGVVAIWEEGMSGQNNLRRFKGHAGSVTAVEYGTDGVLVSAGIDHTIRVRRKEHRRNTTSTTGGRVLRGHDEHVSWLRYQGDGKLASHGGRDARVKLWDLEAGICLSTGRLPGAITCAESDEGVVYVAISNAVHVLDSRQGFAHTVGILSIPPEWQRIEIGALVSRKDGTVLASVGSGGVAIWDARGSLVARGLGSPDSRSGSFGNLQNIFVDGGTILTARYFELLMFSFDGAIESGVYVEGPPSPIVALGRTRRTVWLVRESGFVQTIDVSRAPIDWASVYDTFANRRQVRTSTASFQY